MKTIILAALLGFTAILGRAGPADAESLGLAPSGFIELSDEKLGQVFQEANILIAAFVPREIRSKYNDLMDPVGWFDEERNLCQLRCIGKIDSALFERCIGAGKWKKIKTPEPYLSAMHIGSDAVQCYEGALDDCAAHVVWIEAAQSLMIVAELRKPNKTPEPMPPKRHGPS